MPDRPAALRRDYRIHLQIGAALALALTVLAFTIPTPQEAHASVVETPEEPPILIDVMPTRPLAPPPPPPPAPPPPEEVPDTEEVADLVVNSFDLSLEEYHVPAGPPAPPLAPPAPPKTTTAATPPPVEDLASADDVIEFLPVEDQPVLIGGLEGLQRRVVYPEVAQRVGAQGTVYVRFVVDETGAVVDPEVVRSPNTALGQAALDAIVASQFEPGRQRGRPVKVRYTLPVQFVLR